MFTVWNVSESMSIISNDRGDNLISCFPGDEIMMTGVDVQLLRWAQFCFWKGSMYVWTLVIITGLTCHTTNVEFRVWRGIFIRIQERSQVNSKLVQRFCLLYNVLSVKLIIHMTYLILCNKNSKNAKDHFYKKIRKKCGGRKNLQKLPHWNVT